MGFKPELNQAKIEEINQLTASLMPGFSKLLSLLRAANLHDFEMQINGADKLTWHDPTVMPPHSPNEGQITEELNQILDQQYPPFSFGGFTFMGMIWNPNRALAEKMAKVVAEWRNRDRAQVEAQIVAILAAFKQGL